MMGERWLVLGPTSRLAVDFLGQVPGNVRIVAVGRSDPRPLGAWVDEFYPWTPSVSLLRQRLRDIAADAWINFLARTDVDGCERERLRDPSRPPSDSLGDSAWDLNVELPRLLAQEAPGSGAFLVHLSTDHVFDGTAGPYPEDTPPSAYSPLVSWYGYTKGLGERAVYASEGPRAIVRCSSVYGGRPAPRPDLAHRLLREHRDGVLRPLFEDTVFTPTWAPDVSDALRAILRSRRPGLYHIASPEVTTPAEFARTLLSTVKIPAPDVPTQRWDPGLFREGFAPRPRRGGLRVSEIHKLGARPRTFREGLRRWAEELGGHGTLEGDPAIGKGP